MFGQRGVEYRRCMYAHSAEEKKKSSVWSIIYPGVKMYQGPGKKRGWWSWSSLMALVDTSCHPVLTLDASRHHHHCHHHHRHCHCHRHYCHHHHCHYHHCHHHHCHHCHYHHCHHHHAIIAKRNTIDTKANTAIKCDPFDAKIRAFDAKSQDIFLAKSSLFAAKLGLHQVEKGVSTGGSTNK